MTVAIAYGTDAFGGEGRSRREKEGEKEWKERKDGNAAPEVFKRHILSFIAFLSFFPPVSFNYLSLLLSL